MSHHSRVISRECRRYSNLLGILYFGITMPVSAQTARTLVVRGVDYAFQASDTIPAGLTTFILDNQGTVRHELVIVRLKEGRALSDVIAAKSAEERQRLYDAVVGLIIALPGQRAPGRLVTELTKGGDYVLICNLRNAADKPTHLAQGMGRALHAR